MPVKSCFLSVALFLGTTVTAWAQWSADPAVNLAVADRADSQQVQPKVAAGVNGDWYVSWYDSDPDGMPAFGFDVYLQRLDADGFEQWPHNGVLIADRGFSSTQDYDLAVDTVGNVLLAFRDDRVGATDQVTVTKVDPNGVQLWGDDGVMLTDDSTFKATPKVAAASDRTTVVAWVSDSSVILQKVDAGGVPLWGTGVELSEVGANFSVSGLQAAEDGEVIVSWVRTQGFGSDAHLYANKLSATGALLWGAEHVAIFDGGSLQNGSFPGFVSDGAGGGAFGWYSSSPSLQCFAQRLASDGTEFFPHNGSEGSTNTDRLRTAPSVSYRVATGETFLFWTEQSLGQSMDGVYGQKFDATGARLWTDDGVEIVPLGNNQTTNVQNVQVGDGALVGWVDEESFTMETVKAARLDTDAAITCPTFDVSSLEAAKADLQAAAQADGFALFVWEDERADDGDIFAQNVNPDCSLGPFAGVRCSDLRRARARCRGTDIQIQVQLVDSTHDGQTIDFEINGIPASATIVGDLAMLTATSIGENTVELVDPAGCGEPRSLACPR